MLVSVGLSFFFMVITNNNSTDIVGNGRELCGSDGSSLRWLQDRQDTNNCGGILVLLRLLSCVIAGHRLRDRDTIPVDYCD